MHDGALQLASIVLADADWVGLASVPMGLFIIVARIIDVSLGTMRTLAVVRGYRSWAAGLGFGETLVWLLAVSGALAELNLVTVLAYGIGYAAGNVCGIWMEEKFALGQQMVILVSRGRQQSVAFALRMADYRVTDVAARGGQGRVAMCFVVVPRRRAQQVVRLAREADHAVFVTVQDVRSGDDGNAVLAGPTRPWRLVLRAQKK